MNKERLSWVPYYPSKLLGALSGIKPPDQKLVYQIVLLRIYETGGPIADGLEAIAYRCGINRRRTSDALDALFKAGKLVRETAGIMNPFAAEVLADSVAFRQERKRAGHRGATSRWQKHEENQQTGHGKAMPEPMAKDGSIHLQLKDSEESRTLELSLESEPSLSGEARSKRTRPRKTLPADWLPDDDDNAYAHRNGFGHGEISRQTSAFANYHRSKGSLMADWHAAWRTWIDRECVFVHRRNGGTNGARSGSILDAIDRVFGAVEGTENGASGQADFQLLPPGPVR